MKSAEKTPLWLDLRKEYIDDNFDKLQTYLKECSLNKEKDTFYTTTINLLRERVEDLLNTLSMRPIYEEDNDRQKLIFNVRLLASYLLVDDKHALALPAYIAFLGELRALNSRMSDAIMKAVTNRLRHERISYLGFNWHDLDKIGTDLFAYNVSTSVRFDSPLKKPLVFSKYGTAIVSSEGLFLTCLSKEDSKKLIKTVLKIKKAH